MNKPLNLLIIEDSEKDSVLTVEELRQGGYAPVWKRVETPESMKSALAEQPWDLIISDFSMPHFDPFSALEILHEKELDIPFIIVSGTVGEEAAVKGMKAGAHDYLMKGNLTRLAPAVARELAEAEERKARRVAEQSLKESIERERMLHSIVQAIYNPITLDEKMQVMAEALGNILQADHVFISQFDEQNIRLLPPTREFRSMPDIPSLLESNMQELAKDSESILNQLCGAVEPIEFEPDTDFVNEQARKYLMRQRVQSGLACAIRHGQKCLAILFIHQVHAKRRWNREEVELIEAVSKQASVSMHQAELYERELHLREKLQNYVRKLEQSNKELEHFATIASHDLYEPLRKVKLFSQFLVKDLDKELSGKNLDYYNRMQRAIDRMQEMLDDVLTLSRITRKGEPYVETDLSSVISEVLHEMKDRMEIQNAHVEVGEMVHLQADRSQIKQLIQNLLENSLKFHKPDTPAEIRITSQVTDRDKCEIVVQDNGIGFDEKYTDRIFQLFERLQPKEDYPGTGLGLTIVQKIVERHQGDIEVHSRPDKGTQFKISLPLVQNA